MIPAGVTNLSVGMGLTGQAGSLTMDDFSMFDNAPAPDTTPPTSAIACGGGSGDDAGCPSGFFNGPVEVDLTASDDPGGSGIARIVYTTDGSDPTPTHGSTYSGPFALAQTATVKARAIDKAGNVETAIQSQLIQIDMLAPSATIACNSSPCGSGAFTNTVSVTMNGTDTGGAGIDRIVYTIDGSTPTSSNGNVYIGAFSVNTNTTIKFIAIDTAGNVGTVGTQTLQVDALAPSTTISCNSAPCNATPYNAGVLVALSATDSDGSGVSAIRYTTDGSDPTASSGTVYVAPFTVAATATVKYRAFDNAGNAEAINTQLVTIDATAPTVSLTAPSDGASVSGSVPMSANASDNVAVDHVDFLVDGSTLAGSDGSSPYNVSWDSSTVPDGAHTVVAKAFDTAGNSTTSGSVSITVGNAVDTTAPTSTISCDGAACTSSPYSPGPVSVTLAATDNVGGSGLDKIVYTTDGSDPSVSNGTNYTGAFSLASTTTVKYRAYDLAGNAEAINSQLVTISAPGDTTAPTSTISCDGTSCAPSAYPLPVSVTLAASDDPGGSGVAAIRYTTDGSDAERDERRDLLAPRSRSAQTTTVKYRAIDNAGNIEAVNSQLITIGAAAPSVTIDRAARRRHPQRHLGLLTATVTALTPDHVDFFVGGEQGRNGDSRTLEHQLGLDERPRRPVHRLGAGCRRGGGTTNSNTALGHRQEHAAAAA